MLDTVVKTLPVCASTATPVFEKMETSHFARRRVKGVYTLEHFILWFGVLLACESSEHDTTLNQQV